MGEGSNVDQFRLMLLRDSDMKMEQKLLLSLRGLIIPLTAPFMFCAVNIYGFHILFVVSKHNKFL